MNIVESAQFLLDEVMRILKKKAETDEYIKKRIENIESLTCYLIKGSSPEEIKYAFDMYDIPYFSCPYNENLVLISKNAQILETCKNLNRKVKLEKGGYYQETDGQALAESVDQNSNIEDKRIITITGLSKEVAEAFLKKCNSISPNYPIGVSETKKGTNIHFAEILLTPKAEEKITYFLLSTIISEYGVKKEVDLEQLKSEDYSKKIEEDRLINRIDTEINKLFYEKGYEDGYCNVYPQLATEVLDKLHNDTVLESISSNGYTEAKEKMKHITIEVSEAKELIESLSEEKDQSYENKNEEVSID